MPLPQSLHQRFRRFSFGVPWNLFLITAGSLLVAFAVKSLAAPFGLLTGGMSGLGLLCFYLFPKLSAGAWYFLLNVPVFVLGWVSVSRRFILYSLYGMAAVTVFIEAIDYVAPIQDVWLAVIACGACMGLGIGMAMRSLGSTGGVDILAVMCKERFNISIGTFDFWFNIAVFAAGFSFLDLNVMLYSLAMTLIISMVTDYCLRVFANRVMVLVISERPREVLEVILRQLDRGATVLSGRGGYTGHDKEVVLTMINGIQLKRLEELVYSIDPRAFTIMGSGFHVLGEGFSPRKVY
ncbi:YitT family protein [Desulfovibrio sp.]